MEFSWAFESAVVLNWSLNKTDVLPEIIEEVSQGSIQTFLECIPEADLFNRY